MYQETSPILAPPRMEGVIKYALVTCMVCTTAAASKAMLSLRMEKLVMVKDKYISYSLVPSH